VSNWWADPTSVSNNVFLATLLSDSGPSMHAKLKVQLQETLSIFTAAFPVGTYNQRGTGNKRLAFQYTATNR